MYKNKMVTNFPLGIIFGMMTLLVDAGCMRVMAEELAPEHEQIHIVGLPADEEPKYWTKESNKDGMKVVLLYNPDRLVLLGKDGVIVEGAQYFAPRPMENIIWLNDSSFFSYYAGRVHSLYDVYTITERKGGGYVLSHFCDGLVQVGGCSFVVKGGFLNILKKEVRKRPDKAVAFLESCLNIVKRYVLNHGEVMEREPTQRDRMKIDLILAVMAIPPCKEKD